MDTKQAIYMLRRAWKKGEIDLPRFLLAGGPEVGPEFTVATAWLSAKLWDCTSAEEILAAGERGFARYLRGELTWRHLNEAFLSVACDLLGIVPPFDLSGSWEGVGQLDWGPKTIWFVGDKPVAFRTTGHPAVVCEEMAGRRGIADAAAERVDSATFAKLWRERLAS